jgi:abequosyltransferase
MNGLKNDQDIYFNIGTQSLLAENGYISDPSRISIGNNVQVQAGYHWSINDAASGSTPNLTIKDGCSVKAGLHVDCIHKVHIGRNVQIGPYVSMSDRRAAAVRPGYPGWASTAGDTNSLEVLEVGDGCILGAHCVIAGPVKIGKFSIVEPNSVVMNHVPSYCTVSGNPAVVTKVFVPEALDWVAVNGEADREAALALRREHPLLSIVIPTYNRAHHLNNILHSIYNQICDEDLVEVVVTDNASPDTTQVIGETYASLFSSLHYSRNKQNIGADLNIAHVSSLAKGSFIKLNGDDDYWRDGALIDFIGIVLQNLDCALIHTNHFNSDGQVFCLEGCDQFLTHTSNNAVHMTMNTMKRSVWDQIEDKSKYAYTSINQIYWFYDILSLDPKFCIINRDLYYYAGVAPEGYNVGEVVIKHFLDALQHYEGRALKSETIREEKKKRLYQVILPLYEIIVTHGYSSDVSNYEEYYTEYYANEDYYEEGLLKLRQLSAIKQ